MVLHDFPKGKIEKADDPADFIYLKIHVPPGDYKGNYSDEFLKEKAVQIIAWMNKGKKVYAYFNNTGGNAFQNACTLKHYAACRYWKRIIKSIKPCLFFFASILHSQYERW